MDRLYRELPKPADDGLDQTLPDPAIIEDQQKKKERKRDSGRLRLEIEAPPMSEHDPESERSWREEQDGDDNENGKRGVYEIKF